MAESAEHDFLKHAVNGVLQQFSALKLYTFTETDRKMFDFSSLLERDWKRPVVGQVLWKHGEGVEKDLRSLAHDVDSDIKVYVAKDTIKFRQAFAEIITDYRRSGRYADLFKLRPIWVPADFDADRSGDQQLVEEHLRNVVVTDILFNVVLGNITAEDLRFVLYTSGVGGLQLAILHVIANDGFVNIAGLSARLKISPGPIREKLLILAGADMIQTPPSAIAYKVTPKGRVLLDIVKRICGARAASEIDPELDFVLTKLGCAPVPWSQVEECREVFPKVSFIQLLRTIFESRRWVDLSK